MATKIDPKLQAQIDALEAAFMQARGGGEDFRTAMPNLSPELLSFILTTQAQQDGAGNGLLRGFSDPSGAGFHQYGNYALNSSNPESQSVSYDPSRVDWSQSPIQFGINTDTSNYLANYDQQGRFTGYEVAQDDNNWRDAIVAALMMAPAVAGVYGWAGAAGTEGAALSGMDLAADAGMSSASSGGATWGGTAAAGGTTAGGVSGMDLAADAGMNSVNSAGGTTWGGAQTAGTTAGTSAATKAGTTAGTTAATSGGTSTGTAATAATAGKGLLDIFTADGSIDYAKLATGLLGAYTGYQGGKDQQQTQSRDPWGPAQPYLKGLLSEGADLYGKYKQEPFSPTEQTAYGNYGGLLDTINRGAGGLMQGFDVTASGGNQFVRGKPRNGTLIGAAFEPTAETWNPGLLGNFGTTPPRKKVT